MSHRCGSTEPFGGTKRLSLENVLSAISFFGLTRCHFTWSGRTLPQPADSAASWFGRASPDPADCAASSLGRPILISAHHQAACRGVCCTIPRSSRRRCLARQALNWAAPTLLCCGFRGLGLLVECARGPVLLPSLLRWLACRMMDRTLSPSLSLSCCGIRHQEVPRALN